MQHFSRPRYIIHHNTVSDNYFLNIQHNVVISSKIYLAYIIHTVDMLSYKQSPLSVFLYLRHSKKFHGWIVSLVKH